jgi:hypothetical protein
MILAVIAGAKVAVPVDPGTIKIEAVAAKKQGWSASIEIAQAGKTVTVTVPALDDAPPSWWL